MFNFRSAAAAAFWLALISSAMAQENWPPHNPSEEHQRLGAEAAAKPGQRVAHKVTPYTPDGPYMNWGVIRDSQYRNHEKMKLDSDGLPMVKYGEEFQYNPVTLSQFVVTKHHRYLMGESLDPVVKGVDKLIELQRADGAFPYDFEYKHPANPAPYKRGWISGMAQGQALSAFARAWKVTGDNRYLDAGNRSLDFLQVPFPAGPMATLADLDPSLSGYSFILEYPVKPHAYTLNGYIFTLIGLYDWWKVVGSEKAGELFLDGVRTLERLLPYYDIGTFTTYDISYITHSLAQPYLVPPKPFVHPRYHGIHIELVEVMADVTGKTIFSDYANKWRGYVN